jgi:epoxyqueuosine reductase
VTSGAVKARAAELGFDACGIAPAVDHPELRFVSTWLDRGHHGGMGYLRRTARLRADVRRVLPSARSVIVTATLYNTDRPFSTECDDPSRAHIARYAWGDDYHDVIRLRLDALVEWMRGASPQTFEARAYVDQGPVQERVYAARAGIGWTGRNTCTINPRLGSFILLGEVVCSLPLAPDAPLPDQCGDCTLCLEACPTGALVEPGVLDARKCVSYLTIEHHADLPPEWQRAVGTHVYGCDVCQEVCPWNARAPVTTDPAWQPRPIWDARSVADLWHTGDRELAGGLERSAMARATLGTLRRNLRVALANAAARRP